MLQKYLFGLFGVLFALSAVAQKNESPLWEISGKSLARPSYIFGDMQTTDARAHALSDSLRLKLSQCDVFATHLRQDTTAQRCIAAFSRLFKQEWSAYEDIEDSEVDMLREKDAPPIPVDNMDNALARLKKKGSAWGFMPPAMADTTALPAFLQYLAKKHRRILYGLEESAYAPLEARLEQDKEAFFLAYLRGDLAKLKALCDKYFAKDAEFVQRNYTMLANLERLMAGKSLFAAVHIAHLVGEDGILQNLQKHGYKVRKVTATFKGNLPQPAEWITTRHAACSFDMPQPALKAIDANRQTDAWICLDETDTRLSYLLMRFAEANPIAQEERQKTGMIFLDTLQARLQAERISTEEIQIGGGRYMSALFAHPKRPDDAVWATAFLDEKSIYFFLVCGTHTKLKASNSPVQFAQSFKPLESEKAPKETFISEEGAFSVSFYPSPKHNLNKIQEGGSVHKVRAIHLFESLNVETKESYFVRYDDLPKSFQILNDSLFIRSVLEGVERRGKLKPTISPIEWLGQKGVRFEAKVKDLKLEGRLIVRGNRLYMVMAETLPTTDVRSFFDSFAFLPYKACSWKRYYDKDSIFSMLLPRKVYRVTSGKGWGHGTHDPNAARAFFIRTNIIDKYLRNDLDSICVGLEKDLASSKCDILANKRLDKGKNTVQRLEAYHRVAHNYILGYNAIQGNAYIGLQISGTKDVLEDEQIARALATISINWQKADSTFSVTRSKMREMLAYLYNKDSLSQDVAMKMLKNYNYQPIDATAMHEFLYKDPKAGEIAYELQRGLLVKLKDTKVDTLLTMYKRLYTEERFAENRVTILRMLAELSTDESINTALRLMTEISPDDEAMNGLPDMMEGFFHGDSAAITRFFGRFVEHAKTNLMKRVILRVAIDILRNAPPALHEVILRHDAPIAEFAQQCIERNLADIYSCIAYYKHREKRTEYVAYLKKILQSNRFAFNIGVRAEIFAHFLDMGEPTSQKELEGVLKHKDALADNFNAFLYIAQHPKTQGFAHKYFRPQDIGRVALMEEYELQAQEVVFVGKEFIEFRERKGWVYLYNVPRKNETKDVIEVVGFFSEGKGKSSYDRSLGASIIRHRGETYKQAIEAFLEEEEEARKQKGE